MFLSGGFFGFVCLFVFCFLFFVFLGGGGGAVSGPWLDSGIFQYWVKKSGLPQDRNNLVQ